MAEYYRIPWEEGIEVSDRLHLARTPLCHLLLLTHVCCEQDRHFSFYDESKDAWQKYSWQDLYSMANIGEINDQGREELNGRVIFNDYDFDGNDENGDPNDYDAMMGRRYKTMPTKLPKFGKKKAVDFIISKSLWDLMNVTNIDNSGQNLHDPVGALAQAGYLHPNRNREVYPSLMEVKKACGVRTNLVEGTEEYLHSEQAAQANFISFLKDWLVGNPVPYHVHAFLETLNWQGWHDMDNLLDADARETNFSRLLLAAFNRNIVGQNMLKALREEKWELVII